MALVEGAMVLGAAYMAATAHNDNGHKSLDGDEANISNQDSAGLTQAQPTPLSSSPQGKTSGVQGTHAASTASQNSSKTTEAMEAQRIRDMEHQWAMMYEAQLQAEREPASFFQTPDNAPAPYFEQRFNPVIKHNAGSAPQNDNGLSQFNTVAQNDNDEISGEAPKTDALVIEFEGQAAEAGSPVIEQEPAAQPRVA